jgi:hypothetical protein
VNWEFSPARDVGPHRVASVLVDKLERNRASARSDRDPQTKEEWHMTLQHRLYREHRNLETQLARELRSRFPDYNRIVQLKKMKLLLKDRIASLHNGVTRTAAYA